MVITVVSISMLVVYWPEGKSACLYTAVAIDLHFPGRMLAIVKLSKLWSFPLSRGGKLRMRALSLLH